MTKITLTLDRRFIKPDGSYTISLQISNSGKRKYISLKISVQEKDWDKTKRKIIASNPRDDYHNRYILDCLLKAEIAYYDLKFSLKKEPGLDQLYDSINRSIFPEEESEQSGSFITITNKFLSFKSGSTLEIYNHTLKILKLFDPELNNRSISDITKSWLLEFDSWMIQRGNSPNTRGIHFRNIRAIINYALDEDIIFKYPFRKFKMPKAATFKRNLPVEDLRRLFSWPVEPWQQEHLDYFKLTFFLIGINSADLLSCHHSDIKNGRLEYKRAKTHRLYSIFIEPEAEEIIKRYSGSAHLLAASDRYSDPDNYRRRVNKALQKIGSIEKLPGRGGKLLYKSAYPGITTYWARHTWATIAASLDIPKETIAAALGHGGNTVTDIYIDFDQRKVDEANRRVIDWVLYGKK